MADNGQLGSFVIFRGSRPVLLRNPIFCDTSGVCVCVCGGGGGSGPPSGSANGILQRYASFLLYMYNSLRAGKFCMRFCRLLISTLVGKAS